jgi:diguanylate cyclase (GGDEF)-like protein
MTDLESLRARIIALMSEERGSGEDSHVATVSIADGKEASEVFFSSLLENYVHLDFTEEEAIEHWKNIIGKADALRKELCRGVSIHLAIVDYFTTVTHALNSPMLVEVRVFRQTERLAMIDGLTGIFNRRYMDIILRKEFNRCDRYGKNLSVCILDIDNFKLINDSKGHVFGDQVLRELANLLRESIRDEDIVCRYGGEEFLIILPETDAQGAQILANRIRDEMKETEFFAKYNVTFSAGTATYPSCAREMTDLVLAADRALYQAKYDGKDRVVPAKAERRKFGRFEKSWEVSIFAGTENEPISGVMTQNVSLGGAQFECAINYPIDTDIRLVFTSQEPDLDEVEVEGHITWVRRARESFIYGVSFNETPEFFEATLVKQPGIVRTTVPE